MRGQAPHTIGTKQVAELLSEIIEHLENPEKHPFDLDTALLLERIRQFCHERKLPLSPSAKAALFVSRELLKEIQQETKQPPVGG